MELDEVRAREHIRHTMSTYTFGGDRGRVDLLTDAFTEDGVLEFGGRRHAGRRAIAEALSPKRGSKPSPPGRRFVRHQLTSQRIEFASPDEANAWTYFQVMSPIGVDHSGVYVDRFRRVGAEWLIAHRRVKIDWRDPRSEIVRDLGEGNG